MYPLKKALICLDLSEIDDVLIQYISFLHKTIGFEELTFTHVIQRFDLPEDLSESIPELKQPLGEVVKKELKERLDEYFVDEEIKNRIDLQVREGSETNQIIQLAREQDVDLLILGKKTGYQGKGILPGKIVRFVPCSVMFVPEMARHQIQKILCPIDFDQTSKQAVEEAHKLAMQFKADYSCQHIYSYPKQYFPYIATEKFTEGMEDHLEEQFEEFRKGLDINEEELECTFTLAEGKAIARKVYDQVVKQQVDIIVSGSAGRTKAASYFKGSVADRFANYDFGIPLLIVKDKKSNKSLLDSLLGKD